MATVGGMVGLGAFGGLLAGMGIDTLRSGDSPDYGMDTPPWGIGEIALGTAVAAGATLGVASMTRSPGLLAAPVAAAALVAVGTGLFAAPYVNGHPEQFPVRIGSDAMPGSR